MGDHRLSVEISLTGRDGKHKKIDWYVNWDESQPSKIFDAVVEMAREVDLPVSDYYEDSEK